MPFSSATVGPLLAVRRESTGGAGRREPFVLEAVERIRREACDGLTADDVIKAAPVSRSLFILRFREAVGHSIQNEIEHVRLERVFTLLRDPEMPIGAIASFCGWRSDIALRWLFRRRTGMSMRQWRQKNT
jgi:transcriptional regulator GlxA family with amidase domain